MSNWSKITPDGKGGFDLISNWNIGYELLYRGGAKILVLAFLGAIFGPLFPLFFVLSYPIRTLEGKMENAVTGAAISFLFLLDYWMGGLGWIFYQNWYSEGADVAMTIYMFFGKLNLGLFFLFIILWFVTPSIGNSIDIFEGTGIIFYIFVVILMWNVLMPLAGLITDATMAETPLFFLEGIYKSMINN